MGSDVGVVSRGRKRLVGRWVVALGVSAALAILSLQFVVTRRAYAAHLEAIEAAHTRAGPALLHLAGARRALNGVYRDVALAGGRLIEERDLVQVLLRRHWPQIDAHMRAYGAMPATPGEVGQRQHLELLLDALRAAEPRLLEATTEADARAVLEWQLLPTVREAVRALDALAIECARSMTAAGRQLALAHAHANQLSLVFYVAVMAVVAAAGALAFVIVGRAEREMQRRLEELDAFAGRVAHDLRSPLQPALLTANALRAQCPAISHGLIDRLERSVRQASELVEGLLLFARSGARPEPGSRCAVDEVVRELEPELRDLAAAERAALTLEVEPGVEVAASATTLRSVVGNVARNAILYLGAASTRDVRVVAASDGPHHVLLRVSDTGPGISAELRARLFQPFQRGSTRPGGSGLGLATVKRLVDAHGGTIELATRVGGGTTFTVRLPRAQRHAPSRNRVAGPDAGCAPGLAR